MDVGSAQTVAFFPSPLKDIHEGPVASRATTHSTIADDMHAVMLAAKVAIIDIQEERKKVVEDKKMYRCEIIALEKEVATQQEWINDFEIQERTLAKELKQKKALLAKKEKLEQEKEDNLERIRGLLKSREEQKSGTETSRLKTWREREAEKRAQDTGTKVTKSRRERESEKLAQALQFY